MYDFIDVNETSEGVVLPSEALKINGEYIENQISGYRTLNVAGREALSPDVVSFTTGVRDGSKLKNKRYPERIIVVTYQLIAKSNEEFREAYNKLGGILNVTDAELIFNDEQDKFFVGTPCIIGDVEPGLNSVIGEFEILCTDPFKYSVIEYEAEPSLDESSILVDYNGTYKAYPTLEAEFYNEAEDGENEITLTGAGDCGYVAFFTEDEKIIQLGDPEEIDGTNDAPRSQTLINQTFLSDTAWGTTAKKLWAVNAGSVVPSDVTQAGSVKMAAAGYESNVSEVQTTGTLLKQKKSSGTPAVYYTVTAKTSDRTLNTVKVSVSIKANVSFLHVSLGAGYGLVGSVLVGGYWHDVTIKEESVKWTAKQGYIVNDTFTVSGLGESDSSLTGIKFKVYRSDSLGGTAGIVDPVACSNLPISTYAQAVAGKYYLTAESWGEAQGWHGPSITREIGADASGAIGATNFSLTYKQKMCIGNHETGIDQTGGFHCHLTTSEGTVVAGVRIVKNKTGSRSASLMYFVNGVKVKQYGIDLSYYNRNFGSSDSSVQTSIIKKVGNKVLFQIGEYIEKFTDDDIADLVVTKCTFMFEQYSVMEGYSTSVPLAYNGLFWAKFIKNNCSTLSEIPNKFSSGDVVEADCKCGEIRLNNILAPELGALGNDWESFCLTPGLNQIGFSYSEWLESEYAPKMKVRYREVFL